ncbi:MAG: PilZ domain-containing protein [Candidatus Omnitrophota bacterium]
MDRKFSGRERREFLRLEFSKPLSYKICKRKTLSTLLEGYTSNVSSAGILCNIRNRVKKNDLLWLCFDRSVLAICEDMEKRSFIYQNGIVGKVVRIAPKGNGTYDVGIKFVTREEKNLTNIFPKSYFIEKQMQNARK